MTVGLMMCWPCVVDFVVYPPTDSKACVTEMSTRLCHLVDVAILYHFVFFKEDVKSLIHAKSMHGSRVVGELKSVEQLAGLGFLSKWPLKLCM